MYRTVFFYCFLELNNDVYIYKFNEAENKTIVNRTHIYTPINIKNGICILHGNRNCNHFKVLIPRIPEIDPKPKLSVR